ncbi:MAG: ribosomal L7Ae/L30e/S12e/Gadd45 family protein [Clostridia bacterium]|nr:ribosomal L7Ae/L30e/S12e/Gadd45 family protein [Clostridia bacterium]
MTDKILTLLGFAAKAGKLSFGQAATVASIGDGKAKLVVVGADLSEKSKKEIRFYAAKKQITVKEFTDCDIETLSRAIGRRCGVVSVNDRSFAEAVRTAFEPQHMGGNANDKKI